VYQYYFDATWRGLVALLTIGGSAIFASARADELPDAVTASPEVYEVIAENDSVRVIKATWEPGQADNMHSHPAIGVYFISDCDDMRVHFANGTSRDWKAPTGAAGANDAVAAHSIENVGNSTCQLVFFEPK
jgi:hypothetical protein